MFLLMKCQTFYGGNFVPHLRKFLFLSVASLKLFVYVSRERLFFATSNKLIILRCLSRVLANLYMQMFELTILSPFFMHTILLWHVEYFFMCPLLSFLTWTSLALTMNFNVEWENIGNLPSVSFLCFPSFRFSLIKLRR